MTELTRRLANLSQEKQELFLRALAKKSKSASGAPAHEAIPAKSERIPPRDRSVPTPLSFGQERLWFLERLEPGSNAYNLFTAFEVEGRLDVPVLHAVFREIVRRHEVLRTVVKDGLDGKSEQVILSSFALELPTIDLSKLAPGERSREEVLRLARRVAFEPYDLTHGPLVRLNLLRLSASRHVVVLATHHIVSDAWSYEIFHREISFLYQAFVRGGRSPLPEPAIQYGDFASWQRKKLQGERLERLVNYWKGRLEGAPRALDLPTDRPRSAVRKLHGGWVRIDLSSHLVAEMKALGRRSKATLFMTVLTVFKVLLARYSAQRDISVGTPVAGHNQLELEGVIGFFINNLVLRTDLSGNPSFAGLLERVRVGTRADFAHQDLPFERVVGAVEPERDMSFTPLFQVGINLLGQRLAAPTPPRQASLAIKPLFLKRPIAIYDLSLSLSESEGGLSGYLEYAKSLFDHSTIVRMANHLKELAHGIVTDPEERLSALSLLTVPERTQLLREWNDSAKQFSQEPMVHELFSRHAGRAPHHPAMVSRDGRLSYGELEARSNRLAHYLSSHGVGPEVLVAMCTGRTLDRAVGILGVVKAGGAYVSIDPTHPPERLAFLLSDAGATVILTEESYREVLPPSAARTIFLDTDRERIEGEQARSPNSGLVPENVAYVVYTSGSTGKPKGVAIPHTGLMNLVRWHQDLYRVVSDDRGTQVASPAFDASIWEFWPYLAAGASLHIPDEETRLSSPGMIRWWAEQGITLAYLMTPLAEGILEEVIPPNLELRTRALIIGGDRLHRGPDPSVGFRLMNHYGPAEYSVTSTVVEVPAEGRAARLPTIGRPIDNTQIYLLDRDLRPVPVGVPGELYVGGIGLARGYLRRPSLTAAKFASHPLSEEPGARVYRTGDLVRWLPDGDMDFLGRLDHQVKIRGLRIELGEIENALEQHSAVINAVARVIEEREERTIGRKYLVAYVVLEAGASIEGEALREFLEPSLPVYMIPSVVMPIAKLPLTPNGKVDIKALPVPEWTTQETYVAPASPVEEALARIWAEVLSVDGVGIHDDFFELGGDSILTMQVVSRAGRNGLRITSDQLFEYPTVAKLAKVAREEASEEPIGDAPVTGTARLTAIQRRFFEQELPRPEHFNQAVVLEVAPELGAGVLRRAIALIVGHHDTLRMRFEPAAGAEFPRHQEIAASCPEMFVAIDLRAIPVKRREGAYKQAAELLQASLNLSRGSIGRAALFVTDPERPANLLWILHHLVVDGVSWRIILGDLEELCRQILRGQDPVLPPKSTSFMTWAERINEFAASPEIGSDLDFWRGQWQQPVSPLPRDVEGEVDDVESSGSCRGTLTTEETRDLLQRVPSAYHTQINDILLAALAETLTGWTGHPRVLVDLEGHGREAFAADLDVSRTVGWFTTIFPVVLDLEGTASYRASQRPGQVIKTVKEQLRAVPRNGLGLGLLRYLAQGEAAAALAEARQAEVLFNYLGQLDKVVRDDGLFRPGRRPTGSPFFPGQPRGHLFELNSGVSGGRFWVNWSYGRRSHREPTVQALVDRFLDELRGLIAHCLLPDAVGWTPSDFTLAQVDQPTLDRILSSTGPIDDLYPLSPMQEGMLFHSLEEPESGVYVEQFDLTLEGELHAAAFEQAWRRVIERHAILRTSFEWQDMARPLQVVHTEAALDLECHDWSQLPEVERRARLEAYLKTDRSRGFDLAKVPLLRLVLIRLSPERHSLVWSFHHALLDGWSLPALVSELFAFYESTLRGTRPALSPVRPYREYIAWLAERDFSAAEAFWRSYLRGFEAPTPLGFGLEPRAAAFEKASEGKRAKALSAAMAEELETLARRFQVTLNTMVQASWGALLGRYSGRSDVVFGSVSAGRAAPLPGIEDIVGLFINTLPVRVGFEATQRAADWVRNIQTQQAQARQFEYSPMVKIRGWSDIPPNQALFETILAFENYPVNDFVDQGPDPRSLRVVGANITEQTNYPLSLIVVPRPTLHFEMLYDARRFDSSAIERTLGHLVCLLEGLSAGDVTVGGLPLLTRAERHQVSLEWNNSPLCESYEPCPGRWFERRAGASPEAVALSAGAASWSYRALEARSNRLARYLRRAGVGRDMPVGISMERSVELMTAILAVLKAGGAYVPMDPSYPRERLRLMLEDALGGLGRPVLLADAAATAAFESVAGLRVIRPDVAATKAALAAESGEPLAGGSSAEELAYVIYTSGSTGRPKGVALTRGALANLITWQESESTLARPARTLQFTSFSFDVSFQEIFTTWRAGATLVLVSEEVRREAPALYETICRERIERLFLPSVALRQLAEVAAESRDVACLRDVVAAGEQLQVTAAVTALFEKIPGGRLHNHYGPSETHVVTSLVMAGSPADWPALPSIGRPLANTEARVLDHRLAPRPVGVAGDLFLGGEQLARGYFGRPRLSAERFLPNPFSDRGERLYTTGDLARSLADGTIDFLGRSDHQVKVRGFRVELGEVEVALARHPQVRQAAVVARTEPTTGAQRLDAYVVPEEGAVAPEQGALRTFLKGELPSFMVPSGFVVLEALPLTASGKLDRRALPEPGLGERLDAAASDDPVQQLVAESYAQVLQLGGVGLEDDFFDLGGHSLIATRLISRLRGAFGIELPLKAVFEAPTVRELAGRVAAELRAATAVRLPDIERTVRGETNLPLSFAQQRLWFIHQMDPANVMYNEPMAVRLHGALDVAALLGAIGEIVRRHETLRTTFGMVDGQPIQVVAPAARRYLPVLDLTALPESSRQALARERVGEEARKPFDLAREPAFRGLVLILGESEHVVAVTLHHIATDGWSLVVLRQELMSLYQAFASGGPSPLPDLPVQYADFAFWQRKWLSGETLRAEVAYWHQKLEGAPKLLEMPTDRPRPAALSFAGARHPVAIPSALLSELTGLGRQQGTTLFMTLLAAFQLLLHRYGGQDDIVVGSPIAGRRHIRTEPLIGFFVNMLVLKNDLSGDPEFLELMHRVREELLVAYAHQDLPFEKLVEELGVERHLDRTPVFQAVFQVENPPTGLELPGLEIRPFHSGSLGTALFELRFALANTGESLVGFVEYMTDLFERSTIARLVGHVTTLLRSLVSDPRQRLTRVPILSTNERSQLVREWNDTAREYSRTSLLHDLFTAQASRRPEALALWFGGVHVTYGELDQRTNRLARHLLALGVGRGELVAILIDRSAEMVTALLGILKAGAGYLPLETRYPEARMSWILEAMNVAVTLVGGSQAGRISSLAKSTRTLRHIVCLTRGEEVDPPILAEGQRFWRHADVVEQPPDAPPPDTDAGDMAYVIFTSGSTGTPKGVMVRHRPVVNLIEWVERAFEMGPRDRVLFITSLGFDLSVYDVFGLLAAGGSLRVASSEEVDDPRALATILVQERITFWDSAPAALQQVAPFLPRAASLESSPALRLAFLSGDWIPLSLPRQIWESFPATRIVALGGATEATVWSNFHQVETIDPAWKSIPYGRPIQNAAYYVLDERLAPCPVGVPGDLYIGGECLSSGYAQEPGLTAGKYLPDPFIDLASAVMYRTGDRARLRGSGEIEFLGRLDHQVKIRGFRVELGEIEAVMGRDPGVKQAVVLARGPESGLKQLVGYVVPDPRGLATAVPQGEGPRSADQLDQWQDVWNDTYSPSEEPEDPTFDISGWNSSLTGEPIPAHEMREWMDHTVERILSYHPRRLLEIGCGTGLLLYRIAPRCEHYLATDFAAPVLERIERHIASVNQDLGVELLHCRADDFDHKVRGSFDTIVLNSIVQYFPSVDYLVEVLEKAVDVTADGGRIFVGDVRSLPLLPAFHTLVQLEESSLSESLASFRQRVGQRADQEHELVLDPRLFAALQDRIPRISLVEVRLKRGSSSNEMVRFRYDVTLHVGKAMADVAAGNGRRLDWREQELSLAALKGKLEDGDVDRLVVGRIPNRRVASVVELCRRLDGPDKSGTIGELYEAMKTEDGIDPQELWQWEDELPYAVEISPSGDGRHDCFDACFQLRTAGVKPVAWSAVTDPDELRSAYSTHPLWRAHSRQIVPRLKKLLERQLPIYMMPSAILLLDALPVTANGKLDRDALPEPERSGKAEDYEAPRTSLEQTLSGIWKEILETDRVGIHDNFFEIGGHSLLATRVIARVQDVLKVDLPLRQMFERPTIALLAEAVAKITHSGVDSPFPPLEPVPRDRALVASFAQRRLWFLQHLTPRSGRYNIMGAVRLQGVLAVGALEASMREVVRRHEVLRTTFELRDGELIQQIAPPDSASFARVELRALPESVRDAEGLRLAWCQTQRPMDLRRGPLLRALVVALGPTDHLVLMTMHHAISDGWSLGVFVQELAVLYRAYSAGHASPLPELAIQYADYAYWQDQWLRGELLERELGYWRGQLSALPEPWLPTDRPRTGNRNWAGASFSSELTADLLRGLEGLSRERSLTLFMPLVAALMIALYRWNGQCTQVVGTVVANRSQVATESLIGCFMNFLALRADLSEGMTVSEFLDLVRDTVLGAFEHQACPFEKVVEAVNPDRQANRNPLYNVAILLQNFPQPPAFSTELTASPVSLPRDTAQLDIWLEAREAPDGIKLRWEYATELFEEETIMHLAEFFRSTLEGLVAEPQAKISSILLPAALKAQVSRATEYDGLRLVITSTFTSEPVAAGIEYWLTELELESRVEFAPYSQVFQQLLDPSGMPAGNRRGMNVVLLRLEDWEGAPDRGSETLERNVRDFMEALESAAERDPVPYLVILCPASPEALADTSRAAAVSRMEEALVARFEGSKEVDLITSASLADLYPVAKYADPQNDKLGHVPYTQAFFAALGTMVARSVHRVHGPAYKAIVLDCDGTLWRGICGEDGAEGVTIAAPYRSLQEFMVAQKQAGMLLCLCSKNNEGDVRAVFDAHPDMPLRWEHIISRRINWAVKSENLKSLAAELGLGLESFIFVDDSPLECAEVEARCPEVLALQLPEDPDAIPQFLRHVWAFDHHRTTPEDAGRTELYRANRQRDELRESSPSLADFMADLELEVHVSPMEAQHVTRAAQLTQRTSQLNLTTVRRSEAEIVQFCTPEENEALIVEARDRFGEYGVVGLILFTEARDALEVDTFLLSCRALGREVEHRMLASLGQIACERGLARVEIPFRPSDRNQPAAKFLAMVADEFSQPSAEGTRYRCPAGYLAAFVGDSTTERLASASAMSRGTRPRG